MLAKAHPEKSYDEYRFMTCQAWKQKLDPSYQPRPYIERKTEESTEDRAEIIRSRPEHFDPCTCVDKEKNHFVEAYWWSDCKENASYPFPKATDAQVCSKFLKKLREIQLVCNTTFYFGMSTCRICDECVGNMEFRMKQDGIQFTMPEGALHYYLKHNVHPSSQFQEFVKSYHVENAKAEKLKKEAEAREATKNSKNSWVQFQLREAELHPVDPKEMTKLDEERRTRFFTTE